MAEQARDALLTRIAGRDVTLCDIRYGTYAGRMEARVSMAEVPDVGQALLASGLARAFAGRGPRSDRCG